MCLGQMKGVLEVLCTVPTLNALLPVYVSTVWNLLHTPFFYAMRPPCHLPGVAVEGQLKPSSKAARSKGQRSPLRLAQRAARACFILPLVAHCFCIVL